MKHGTWSLFSFYNVNFFNHVKLKKIVMFWSKLGVGSTKSLLHSIFIKIIYIFLVEYIIYTLIYNFVVGNIIINVDFFRISTLLQMWVQFTRHLVYVGTPFCCSGIY